MIEASDRNVYNPFTNEYENCYCEFELHIESKRLVSSELVKAVSKAEVDVLDIIPLSEKGEIEEKFEIEYRENMA